MSLNSAKNNRRRHERGKKAVNDNARQRGWRHPKKRRHRGGSGVVLMLA